jgi:hypothetical protein
MPDAPSESEAQCRSIPGKIFNFVPGNGARNVSIRSHPWIAAGAEPDAHQFMSRFVYKRGVIEWKLTQNNVVLTPKLGQACMGK